MNIILVIFDSLRKDCINCYGHPPWGRVATPHLDAFARQSLQFMRAFPEALPTLPARRSIYTGKRVYPFVDGDFRLKGDFVGAPGWGPIPEDQDTLAEVLKQSGYRTGLISDVYHMFKPSKNYTRGFDQWMFLRGQEIDPYRSGPEPSREQLEYYLPHVFRERGKLAEQYKRRTGFLKQCLMNMHDRVREEDFFNARVFIQAARWLQQNRDADRFFLTVESFDPHEPWFVPRHYREMYDSTEGKDQVLSGYSDSSYLSPELLKITQANYSGLVTMCDRWFGYFLETVENLGLLDKTVIVVTSDHGHSIGDRSYIGKRGYPSAPEVYEVPLFVRHPDGEGHGQKNSMFVQHNDITAAILNWAGAGRAVIDGIDFWKRGVVNGESIRDHVTVAWGAAVTVVTPDWWMNCRITGEGPFLYDLNARDPFALNVADENPDVVNRLYRLAVADAGGGFPEYLLEVARKQADAPGCSALAARA